jgi:hypothetical protein
VISETRMTAVGRHKRALCDQVRVAYGVVPSSLEGLPVDDPFRVTIRNRARSLLVELGYLTSEELGTLPVKNAISTTLRRFRDEINRPHQGRTTRPGNSAACVAPRAM